MFWSSDLAASVSKLDELLKNNTATLADVLEDDYAIQEIRNGNHQLINLYVRIHPSSLHCLVANCMRFSPLLLLSNDGFPGFSTSLVLRLVTWQYEPYSPYGWFLMISSVTVLMALSKRSLRKTFNFYELRKQSVYCSLTRQEVIAQMIKGALEPEIDERLPLKEQYKKAHLCAEILSINNEELSRAVINNEEACNLLFDFLDSRKLNHVIVNFYMKIFSQIISRFPDQVFPRMKESQFLIHCMRSMNHSAVMELLYRIVSGLSNVEQQDYIKQVSIN
ncbi:unnamed protein product [Wuchereria bancrofti]|uniref:Uncharacterized protein n=1 Tax=Wuchereria bancrofti TaxID=6293 RepID=A0A3P7DIS3_WUCBA|nr:unnamed protein product [Wuchereria bancrofti]